MIKKGLVICGVILLTQLMIFSCCQQETYFSRITDLKIANHSLQTQLANGLTVSQSDFRIRLTLEEVIFAQSFKTPNFINSAYATSCEDIWVGLKSSIVEFEIRSNRSIFGIAADESLDLNKIRVYADFGYTDNSRNQRITVSEWISRLNTDGYAIGNEWYIEFQEPLNSDEFLKFDVLIKQEDGTEFYAETNSVKIE